MPTKWISLSLSLALLGLQVVPAFDAYADTGKADYAESSETSEPSEESKSAESDLDSNEFESELTHTFSILPLFVSLSEAPAPSPGVRAVIRLTTLERPPRA